MIVRFYTKDANISDDILETMERKLHLRLDRYFREESSTQTEVFVKIVERKPFFKVEINMPYMGYRQRTETQERGGAIAALDKGIDTLERQMEKSKTRVTKRHRAPSPVPVVEEAYDDTYDYRVVKEKKYEMKPMTVQDALHQMEMLGHTFYMFKNSDNGTYCTVYHRNDGDYGLIEPET